jgi:hypothetical protein
MVGTGVLTKLLLCSAALMQLKLGVPLEEIRDLVASGRSGKAEEMPVPGALPGLFAHEHGVRRASGSMKPDMRAGPSKLPFRNKRLAIMSSPCQLVIHLLRFLF